MLITMAEAPDMYDELRGHSSLKATAILLLFAIFLGTLLVVPGLRRAPSGAPVDSPAGSP